VKCASVFPKDRRPPPSHRVGLKTQKLCVCVTFFLSFFLRGLWKCECLLGNNRRSCAVTLYRKPTDERVQKEETKLKCLTTTSNTPALPRVQRPPVKAQEPSILKNFTIFYVFVQGELKLRKEFTRADYLDNSNAMQNILNGVVSDQT
jgi:hypothetical protein